MQLWREFFALNQTIILFVYGQVFFLLGVAIIWQSRRHSRLDLARSLGWLGAFGLTHGLHEWGDIFIPIQAEYLSQAWIEMLLLVQVCLLAFSFACLFQFGVETVRPYYPHLPWIQVVPAGLLLVWITGFLWVSQVARWDATRLVSQANVWARYLLGFTDCQPGSGLLCSLCRAVWPAGRLLSGEHDQRRGSIQLIGGAAPNLAVASGVGAGDLSRAGPGNL